MNNKLLKQDEDYIEVLNMLHDSKKCQYTRPTGFGKTYMAAKFVNSGLFNRILYIHPGAAVANTFKGYLDDKTKDNVTIMSYQLIARRVADKAKDWIEQQNGFDLIVFDENHKMGAELTMVGLQRLCKANPDACLLGVTATPNRGDAVDFISRFFSSYDPITGEYKEYVASDYNFHDAFQDRILLRPYYACLKFAKKDENMDIIRKYADSQIELVDDVREKLRLKDETKAELIKISNLYNMPNVIKRACDKIDESDYYKFIVFFKTFKDIHDKKDQVMSWFKDAFTDFEVCDLIVTSENSEYKENRNKLFEMKPVHNRIDLIFSCDMLNLGYHINDLSGIVMYRGTSSGIIYIQQLGRVLMSGDLKKHGIVIDVVDNLHVNSLYEVLNKESKYTTEAKKRKSYLENKKQHIERYNDFKKYCDENGIPNENIFDDVTDKMFSEFVKTYQNEDEWFSDIDDKELIGLQRRFSPSPSLGTRPESELTPEDLIAVDVYSDYYDLIAKLVAEPISMRCRQAVLRWVEEGGVYKHDDGSLYSRAEVLEQQPPTHIPLEPFAYCKKVSVDQVMNYLGITNEMDPLIKEMFEEIKK